MWYDQPTNTYNNTISYIIPYHPITQHRMQPKWKYSQEQSGVQDNIPENVVGNQHPMII